jgi:hypothetical protein
MKMATALFEDCELCEVNVAMAAAVELGAVIAKVDARLISKTQFSSFFFCGREVGHNEARLPTLSLAEPELKDRGLLALR